ncbi:hypothetical protein ACFL23_03070 [Patescibacteria group bacterium]
MVNSNVCYNKRGYSNELEKNSLCRCFNGMYKNCNKGYFIVRTGGVNNCVYLRSNQVNRIQQNG